MRALVVDDEEDIRTWLKIELELDGWEVRVAASGNEGIGAFGDFSPDMLVLDYMMPDITGTQVAEVIRKQGFTGPILMFTGFMGPEIKKRTDDLELIPISKVDTQSLFHQISTIKKRLR